jgi:hypothetical protein
MSAPDYSMAATSRLHLSVRLPKETLYSSLRESSRYFNFDSETAKLARDADEWLTTHPNGSGSKESKDANGISRPSSIAPSNFSVRSLPADYSMPEYHGRDFPHPVMGSVRHNEIRPRSAAPTESTEKLRSSPPVDGVETTGPEQEYPTGVKLGLITLALCLAVFVMALGKLPIAINRPCSYVRQLHHCNRYSKNHRCFRKSQ